MTIFNFWPPFIIARKSFEFPFDDVGDVSQLNVGEIFGEWWYGGFCDKAVPGSHTPDEVT